MSSIKKKDVLRSVKIVCRIFHMHKDMDHLSNILIEQVVLLTKSQFGYIGTLKLYSGKLFLSFDYKYPESVIVAESDPEFGRHPGGPCRFVGENEVFDNAFFRNNEDGAEELPSGHPPLKTIMRIPLLKVKEPPYTLIIGLANAASYGDKTLEKLAPLFDVCRCLYRSIEDYNEVKYYKKMQNVVFSNMSHEMRTPLNAILNFTRLLKQQNYLTDRQHNYLNVMQKSGDQLCSIVNDLLDYSRILSGKMKLKEKPFEIRKCIETVMELLHPKAQYKKINLIYSISMDTPKHVIGDVDRISQVLNNLVNNAIKFTFKGTVKINVKLKKRYKNNKNRCKILFEVEDTGIGIDIEDQDRIFEWFAQAQTVDYNTGIGLGLALCKNIVKLIGGKIWVHSEPNRGSTFSFVLYMDESDELIYERYKKGDLKNKTVLIVDDDPANREILFNRVIQWEMNPYLCSSGQEALLYTTTNEFDIAFIDIRMPNMNGEQLAVKLKNKQKNLPLVAVSSVEIETNAELFDYNIDKPVTEEKLLQSFHKVFRMDKESLVPKKVENRSDFLILVVEDDDANALVLKETLTILGYLHVDITKNGLDAIKKIKKHQYDVILMDLSMPGMSGIELTEKIMQLRDTPPVIIAVTANTLPAMKDKAYQAGMEGYLTKPVDPVELETMIDIIYKKIKKP